MSLFDAWECDIFLSNKTLKPSFNLRYNKNTIIYTHTHVPS